MTSFELFKLLKFEKIYISYIFLYFFLLNYIICSESESESELFTGDTSKDNHSPGPVFREVSP